MKTKRLIIGLAFFALISVAASVKAVNSPSFDFHRIEDQARKYTVIVDASVEFSFGMQTAEQQERLLGTIVTEDGLILVDGTVFSSDQLMSSAAGFHFKSTPTKIEVKTLDGDTFNAEYIGADRFTRIGFLRITDAGDKKFSPVQFKMAPDLKVGDWVALFMLLPEFIDPPLAGDVGMISALVTMPEKLALTVGFSGMQVPAVLYDQNYQPVGVLGPIMDPTAASSDASGMLESFNQFNAPLLGVITPDRLMKLIKDPPKKGEIDRGWLGIELQALTTEMAHFWHIDAPGGIIVNDIVNNSPAYQGGLKVGDIVIGLNGSPIPVDKEENLPVFQRRIAEMGPGAKVDFLVLRNDEEKTDTLDVNITLAQAPKAPSDAEDYESKELEMKVRNMVFSDYLRNKLDSATFEGVVVSEIKPGGLADIGGLQIGDIIQRVEGTDIHEVGDFKAALEKLEGSSPREVIFFVFRDNKTLFINVKTDWN